RLAAAHDRAGAVADHDLARRAADVGPRAGRVLYHRQQVVVGTGISGGDELADVAEPVALRRPSPGGGGGSGGLIRRPAPAPARQGASRAVTGPRAAAGRWSRSISEDDAGASSVRSNLAQVATMGDRATDRVPVRGSDQQIEVGARRPERIVAGRAGLGTG